MTALQHKSTKKRFKFLVYFLGLRMQHAAEETASAYLKTTVQEHYCRWQYEGPTGSQRLSASAPLAAAQTNPESFSLLILAVAYSADSRKSAT